MLIFPVVFSQSLLYSILLRSAGNIITELAFCIRLTHAVRSVPEIVRHMNTCPLCGGIMVFAGLISKAYAET